MVEKRIQSIAAALGALLEYPMEDWRFRAANAEVAAADCPAAELLRPFLEEAAELSLESLQELYTRTFDLAPSCVPYLSVHLFGEESFKRAHLMSGLAEAYRRASYETGGELPDHLSVVLQFAPALNAGEWEELKECCLRPALEKMVASLDGGANPFRRLLAAIEAMLASAPTREYADA